MSAEMLSPGVPGTPLQCNTGKLRRAIVIARSSSFCSPPLMPACQREVLERLRTLLLKGAVKIVLAMTVMIATRTIRPGKSFAKADDCGQRERSFRTAMMRADETA